MAADEVPSAGWARDPVHDDRLRYWDGAAWTARVFDATEGSDTRLPSKKPELTVDERPDAPRGLADAAFLDVLWQRSFRSFEIVSWRGQSLTGGRRAAGGRGAGRSTYEFFDPQGVPVMRLHWEKAASSPAVTRAHARGANVVDDPDGHQIGQIALHGHGLELWSPQQSGRLNRPTITFGFHYTLRDADGMTLATFRRRDHPQVPGSKGRYLIDLAATCRGPFRLVVIAAAVPFHVALDWYA